MPAWNRWVAFFWNLYGFYREAAAPADTTPPQTLESLTQLQGLRVNVGTPGSGIPNLMAKLLDSNHIDAAQLTYPSWGRRPPP